MGFPFFLKGVLKTVFWRNRRILSDYETAGRCTNSRIGPMWDNPKLRHFYWSLSGSADSTANNEDVI